MRFISNHSMHLKWGLIFSFCSAIFLFPLLLFAEETNDYVHYRLGVKYKNEKKFDQAIDEFRRVLAVYPDNYNTYMHLAEIREYEERYRLAIYNLKKALAYNPGWGKAHKMLASIYEKDGQFQNSIKELQDYLQICDPVEGDSIQMQIDRIMSIVKYGGRERNIKENETAKGPQTSGKPELVEASLAKTGKKSPAKSSGAGSGGVKNDAAEAEFNKGVAAYSEGVTNQNQQDFETALQHFRKTLSLQPKHPGAFYYAGLIRRRNGQNSMAKINFEKAVDYPELGHNAYFYLGKIYGEEKKFKEAIAQLEQYIARTDYEPGKREAQSLIERFTSAYNASLPDTVKVDIQALGQDDMHREISKIPEETAYTSLEVRIDSLLFMSIVDTLTEPGQAMLKGINAFRASKFDEAIDLFKNVLVTYPKGDVAARCTYNIGVCYMKLKNYSAADNKFQQVLNQHHTHVLAAQSLFMSAMSYAERKDAAQAEKLYRKFIQMYRNHEWTGKAYEKLGDAYTDLMDDKKAVDGYSHAAEIAQMPVDNVCALFKLGNAYFRIGNAARAVESLQKAIVNGEKNGLFMRVPDSYYKIADYYYQQKDMAKALEYYQKVTRKYPGFQDTPWGLFQTGSVYKNMKKFDKAIKTFNELVDRYPDDYWARQAKLKLEDAVWEHEYRAVLK